MCPLSLSSFAGLLCLWTCRLFFCLSFSLCRFSLACIVSFSLFFFILFHINALFFLFRPFPVFTSLGCFLFFFFCSTIFVCCLLFFFLLFLLFFLLRPLRLGCFSICLSYSALHYFLFCFSAFIYFLLLLFFAFPSSFFFIPFFIAHLSFTLHLLIFLFFLSVLHRSLSSLYSSSLLFLLFSFLFFITHLFLSIPLPCFFFFLSSFSFLNFNNSWTILRPS